MTVDKMSTAGLHQGRELSAGKTRDAQLIDFVKQKRTASLQQQTAPPPAAAAAPASVSVSLVAKEMFNAVHSGSVEDEFDREKIEQIRQEIASGRFPIDEERLARKFQELEQQLGDLGR
jgi:flagellar biosynthesis anti-sigma factor FlgM